MTSTSIVISERNRNRIQDALDVVQGRARTRLLDADDGVSSLSSRSADDRRLLLRVASPVASSARATRGIRCFESCSISELR